jgi:hypothetical protein
MEFCPKPPTWPAMFSEEILLELPSNSLGPSVVRTAP